MAASSLPISCASRIALLADFVADAPENDGRVIAVAADHCPQIPLVPIIEKQMIIVSLLLLLPRSQTLRPSRRSPCGRKFEQFRRGRIVAGANRVARPFFQNLKLAFERGTLSAEPKRAEIVMIADAIDGNGSPLRRNPFVGSELAVRMPKGFGIRQRPSVPGDRSDDDVTIWFFKPHSLGLALARCGHLSSFALPLPV